MAFTRRIALTLTICLAAVLLPEVASAAAATYYVSPSGSDSARGTSAAPLQTIGKAASVARSGDTVLVEPGRYQETVSLGKTDSGVTFQGTGATRPVIDGAGVRRYGFNNTGADNATIEDFEITGQTDAGIYSKGTGDLITANLIHHIGSQTVVYSNGVRVVNGASDRVSGNTIYAIGPGGESMGIWLVQTRNAMVDGNTVYLVRKEGIRDWQGLDNTMTGNRLFLNWVGIAFNMSTGSVATNNYLYDNTEGLDAKHTSYQTVLSYWGLSTPHWSRFWHNTIYGSTETSIWIAQSDQPADYLDIEDNIFDDAGTALVRDAPTLRGPHVIVDGNAYVYSGPSGRPAWIYKAGWTTGPGLTDWNTYRSQLGWEQHGILLATLALLDPAQGDLDYAPGSPAAAGSINLGDSFGAQLGARGLAPATVEWTPYQMTPIDSSSKGTWSTTTHLADSADNNQNSYWTTSTASNEYVTYDFGGPRTFDHLVLTLFSHMDPRSPHGYRFDVSNDLVHWQTVLSGVNPDDEGSSYKYELPAPVTSRYLRFTMVDTFCSSYNPRTSCGAYFVLSDLSAGLLSPIGTSTTTSGSSTPAPSGSLPSGPTGASLAPAPVTGIRSSSAARRPSSTPAPRAAAARQPVVAAALLLARRRALQLELVCRSGAGIPGCRGTVALALLMPRASTQKIGQRSFSIPTGRHRLLRVRIGSALLHRLERHRVKRLRVTLAVPGRPTRARVIALRFAHYPRPR